MRSLWKALARWRLSSLVARVPLVGEVENHILVEGADFDDREFGASRAMPAVLEIPVGDSHRKPADVGRIVKERFFPDEPDFIFNVAFSCGDPGLCGPGVYADPLSIWFNVFFGYYQIDVPVPAWKRPFGYESADPGAPIAIRDILRIGKADWNWFSNYVYGVPRDVIEPLDRIGEVPVKIERGVVIGRSAWDEIELDGVQVVSPYVAPGERGRLCNPDEVLSPVWRAVFGRPRPRREVTTSFFPTAMRAKLYMSFHAVEHDPDLGGPAFATLIFGGTVRKDHPDPLARERFLDRQLAAVRRVMQRRYADSGFALPAPARRVAP